MPLRFLWPNEETETSKRTILKQWKQLILKKIDEEEVAHHLEVLQRSFGDGACMVLVAGFRVPGRLLNKVINWKSAWDPKTQTWSEFDSKAYSRSYVDKKAQVKRLAGEVDRLRYMLRLFSVGGMDGSVLVLFSRWSGKKKTLRALLSTPPTIFHVPTIREVFVDDNDPEMQFSVPLSPELRGLLCKARWAVESARICTTDSAYFIELYFPPGELNPRVRFNTGRKLKDVHTPWVHTLLNFTLYTVENGFYAEDEPVIVFSVILSDNIKVITGVRIRAADTSDGTKDASQVLEGPGPSGTSEPDQAEAEPPS